MLHKCLLLTFTVSTGNTGRNRRMTAQKDKKTLFLFNMWKLSPGDVQRCCLQWRILFRLIACPNVISKLNPLLIFSY